MATRCNTVLGMITALLAVVCGSKPPVAALPYFQKQPRTTYLTRAVPVEEEQRLCTALHVTPRKLRQLLAEKSREARTADTAANQIVVATLQQQSAAVLWME